jgi:hypothetical protein
MFVQMKSKSLGRQNLTQSAIGAILFFTRRVEQAHGSLSQILATRLEESWTYNFQLGLTKISNFCNDSSK